MKTIRQLIDLIAKYTDFDTSHYIASGIMLPLEGPGGYHYSTMTEEDIRNELDVNFGETLSVFKKGHIHIVHCCLPREFVTSEIEKYRDHRDPAMYKYWLPERVFNSILHDHPVDIDAMIEIALNRYLQSGYEWDDPTKYDAIMKQYLDREG